MQSAARCAVRLNPLVNSGHESLLLPQKWLKIPQQLSLRRRPQLGSIGRWNLRAQLANQSAQRVDASLHGGKGLLLTVLQFVNGRRRARSALDQVGRKQDRAHP